MHTHKMPTYDCRTCTHRYVGRGGENSYVKRELHPGEVFCTKTPRIKKFWKKELRKKPPHWCPLRKPATEVTLYNFKSEQDEFMFQALRSNGTGVALVERRRYTITDSATTTTPIADYFKNPGDIEGLYIPMWAVVTLDDGLVAVAFVRTPDGYRYEPWFLSQ